METNNFVAGNPDAYIRYLKTLWDFDRYVGYGVVFFGAVLLLWGAWRMKRHTDKGLVPIPQLLLCAFISGTGLYLILITFLVGPLP